ncbi:DUF3592 domain-containing protein [Streptomyces sp. NRRL S-350]|uniref:DUF3592 domain-containing protein n=1 Tax=Streptomyces sp. NRRL S-350 TaxID=1463902 RepID=UPI00131A8BE6|nr:DUF3592 domain-containing protein [Streptomyces sp. NRRL S-350]
MSGDKVVWSVLGFVGAAAGVAVLVGVVLRTRLRARTLARGLTAWAECLETYVAVETRGAGTERRTFTERHVILGFRTPDGLDVRFRDRSGVPRVVGDRVRVRYLPERPQGTVTPADRHPSGLTPGLVAGAVCALVVVGVGVACAVLGLQGPTGEAGGATTPTPLTSSRPGWGPGGKPTSFVCTDDDGPHCIDDKIASLFPRH